MIANAIIKAMQVMTITVIVVEFDVFSVEPALLWTMTALIHEGGIIIIVGHTCMQGQILNF